MLARAREAKNARAAEKAAAPVGETTSHMTIFEKVEEKKQASAAAEQQRWRDLVMHVVDEKVEFLEYEQWRKIFEPTSEEKSAKAAADHETRKAEMVRTCRFLSFCFTHVPPFPV